MIKYISSTCILAICLIFLSACNIKEESRKTFESSIGVEPASSKIITLGEKGFNSIETNLDKYSIIGEQVVSVNIEHPYSIIEREDYNYIISKGNFKVFRYGKDFKKELNTIGNTGRGPGEGHFINAYTITSKKIILYDSSLKKLICYDLKGNIKFEKIINNDQFPFVINSLNHVSKDVYLATGISRDQQRYLNQKKIYNNLYLVKINSSSIDVIDSKSILPKNIIRGIKEDDVVASTVSNPFKLSKTEGRFFMFNMMSGQINNIKVLDDSIAVEYSLNMNEKLFKYHPKISMQEYNQDEAKRNAWMYTGNFMIDIFSNENFLFLYTSNFQKGGRILYDLLVVDHSSRQVIKKIRYSDRRIIRKINDDRISFFDFNEEANSYEYSVMSIDDLLRL